MSWWSVGSAFRRAVSLTFRGRWQTVVAGVLLAFFPPVLLVLLGMILDSKLDQESQTFVWARRLTQLDRVPGPASQAIVAVVATLVAFGQALVGHWYRRSMYEYARGVATELKRRIHQQVFRLGTQDSLEEGKAWAEELMVDRTETVRRGIIQWCRTIPHAVVLCILLWLVAFGIHFWQALLTVLLAILVWKLDGWFRQRARSASYIHRQHAERADRLLAETLRLAPLATGYAMTSAPAGPVAEYLRQQDQEGYRADLAGSARSPWYWMLVLWAVAFWLLLFALSSGTTLAGNLVMVVALVASWFPLQRLRRWGAEWLDYERAAREVFAYVDREPSVRELPGAEPLGRLQRELRFDSVTVVDRHGAKLLQEVSFVIPALSRVAVVATDERVPRALIELLPRLQDPVSGRILYDERDLRFATVVSARQQTLLVLKDAMVFTGSVWENITCGEESFTTDQVHDAAKAAQAIDFILQLPDSFETVIGEHGHRLEPWQAFRIALARALVRNPSVLVLDEPDTPLPDAERAAVELAVQNATQGRTTLWRTKRLQVLRSVDAVLLFHNGQLIGHAKHLELLNQSELYKHLNYLWFNPFPHIR